MDILMPEMNGLECSSLLRSEPGPNRDTPIIAWSAHCSREDMLRHTAYGINDWLIKPPLPAVLTCADQGHRDRRCAAEQRHGVICGAADPGGCGGDPGVCGESGECGAAGAGGAATGTGG